jgi:signal transduction histidine kinase
MGFKSRNEKNDLFWGILMFDKINNKIPLKRYISKRFFKAALLPLLVIELTLVIIYFAVNTYSGFQTKKTLEAISKSHLQEIAGSQSVNINEQLRSVTSLARILQSETERFFNNHDSFANNANIADYNFAQNGVFYKLEDDGGSSLYYSALHKIGEKEKRKAIESESLDPIYKHIFGSNASIVAVYLNTYDSMNRYYPFIKDCYSQYPAEMNIPEYNFYYLGDQAHNPKHKPVWTEAYLDPAGQGWMMSCVVPIYRGEFLEGVAGIDITIDKFVNNILSLSLPWNAKAFLVDANGTIMAMPQEVAKLFGLHELHKYVYTNKVYKDTFKPNEFNLKNSRPEIAASVQSLLERQNGVEKLNISSESYFLTQTTVDEAGWKLFIIVNRNEIIAPTLHLINNFKVIGYSVIGLMIVFYLAFFGYLLKNTTKISSDLAEPVETIVKASSKLSKGDYDFLFSQSQIEEMEILSSSFANMAGDLKNMHLNLETIVQERTSQLEIANQELKNFVYIASHDLREPLRKIIVFGDMLTKSLTNKIEENDAESLHYMIDGAQRMKKMIDGLLSYSRVTTQAQQFQNVDLNQIIEEICKFELSVLIEEKNVLLETPGKLPVIVGDPVQITQLMQNLIANGIKYQKKGNQPKISIISKTAADGMVRIEITDNGIGIRPEFHNSVFGMFKRLHSNEYEGTGIGLATCKKIVERHNGKIGIESQPDKGSTFWFTVEQAKVVATEPALSKK